MHLSYLYLQLIISQSRLGHSPYRISGIWFSHTLIMWLPVFLLEHNPGTELSAKCPYTALAAQDEDSALCLWFILLIRVWQRGDQCSQNRQVLMVFLCPGFTAWHWYSLDLPLSWKEGVERGGVMKLYDGYIYWYCIMCRISQLESELLSFCISSSDTCNHPSSHPI